MSLSVPATVHHVYGQELAELLDTLLTGKVVTDRAINERLIRAVGALRRLHQRHVLNERGWCGVCWKKTHRWWRPWPARTTCTVHAALTFYLRQPTKTVLTALSKQRPR